MSDRYYLFLDFETTGLGNYAKVLEIAAKLFRADKMDECLLEFHRLLPMSTYSATNLLWEKGAFELHQKTGLLDEMRKAGLYGGENDSWSNTCAHESSLNELHYRINQIAGEDAQVLLAGYGPHFDRRFMEASNLDRRLHYRHIDVNVLRYAMQDAGFHYVTTKGVGLGSPGLMEKAVTHRAMDDVNAAIAEWRCYVWQFSNLDF